MGKVASAQLHHGNVQGDIYIYNIYIYIYVLEIIKNQSNLCSLKFTKKKSSTKALNSEQSEQSQADLQQLQVDQNPNV